MNEKRKKISPEIRDLIINAAYGSTGILEKLKVKRLIKTDPELKAIYDEYKQTADSVHKLSKEKMPNSVLQNVEKITESKLSKKSSSFFDDLASIFYTRPQFTFAAAAILTGIILFSVFTKDDSKIDYESSQYTKAEVELANQQAKSALLFVSQVLSATSITVAEEIIPNKVVKPLNESFEYVNDLFKKGDI